MAGTVNLNKFAYRGDYSLTFDLVLEKFGVDLSKLDYTVEPKRKFTCWIEDWEFSLVKKNECVAKSDFLDR